MSLIEPGRLESTSEARSAAVAVLEQIEGSDRGIYLAGCGIQGREIVEAQGDFWRERLRVFAITTQCSY